MVTDTQALLRRIGVVQTVVDTKVKTHAEASGKLSMLLEQAEETYGVDSIETLEAKAVDLKFEAEAAGIDAETSVATAEESLKKIEEQLAEKVIGVT